MNGSRKQFPSGLRPGSPPAAAISVGRLGRVLALLVTLAALTLPAMPAAALPLPWQRPTAETRPAAMSRGLTSLQEVPPPAAVQQLQSALAGRQPVVEILSPPDDATLPPGPWTLKLRVHDWPLVDGGDLGAGPHLVVQLDQEPPQIWTRSEGVMPELAPGSHRLTVYAAQPWGEARKNPGAVQQIRLHRTAANPLSLPAPGSPQLLAVSPSGSAGEEPLLLDWLLLDAPLQDVGGSGSQWRLRVSINEDAVLLDQQASLWLRGWRPGPNALRLELLDARGEPLNPPFNSLVQEVDVHRTESPPRWGGPPLSASELAILLGEAPATPLTEAGSPSPARAHESASLSAPPIPTETEAAPALEPLPSPEPGADEQPEPQQGEVESSPVEEEVPDGADLSPELENLTNPLEPGPAPLEAESRPAPSPDREAPDQDNSDAQPGDRSDSNEDPPERSSDFAAAEPPEAVSPATDTPDLLSSVAESDSGDAAPHTPQDTMTAAPSTAPPPAPPPTAASAGQPTPPPFTETAPSPDSDTAERIRPSSALTGRARDLVNDDGTLRRPEQRGPLAGLREWLQR